MNRILPTLLLFLMSTTPLPAVPPSVTAVNIRGMQIGGTTTLTFSGRKLLPNPRVVFSVPMVKQVVRPNPAANRVEIEITLDDRAKPGLYNLWLANDNGLSAVTVVAIDRLPQQPFAAEVKTLPVAMHGVLSGSQRLRSSFTGKAGQQVVFEVEANRIGGKIRPVLHLYDAANQHLKWSMPSPSLRGDTRLEAKLPADGKYTIELHDLQYAAPAPNFFRLKIGNWQYADAAFPLAIQRGKSAELELLGNVPADKRVPFTTTSGRVAPVPLLDEKLASGLRPAVTISDFPELVESKPKEGLQQLPAIPSAVSGRLSQPGEIDQYQLAVKAGMKLRFDVFADRIGSPVDAVLEVKNGKGGGRLAFNDDARGSPDSRVDYTVANGVEAVIVEIRDNNAGGGSRSIYRIVVTDVLKPNDFQLTVDTQQNSVVAGGRKLLKVTALRNGYNGAIQLSFDDLPTGVQMQGGRIPAGAKSTLVTLHGAGTNVADVLTSLRGTAIDNDVPVVRYAKAKQNTVAAFQPWLGSELAIAMARKPAIDFDVDWSKLPDDGMFLGGRFKPLVKCVRPVGFDGPVRLTLVTSQVPPLANNQPAPNRTLRSESGNPVEIPANAAAQKAFDVKVAADKELTAAQANQTKIAANGKKTTTDADAKVKQATARLTAAAKAATDATAVAKTAADARVNVGKSFAESVAQFKEVIAAVDKKGGSEALVASAKATADAATRLQDAAKKKMVAEKAATDAAAKAKTAADARNVAQKAVTSAQAELKTVTDAVNKANAAEAAKAKQASDKVAATLKQAEVAALTAKNDGEFSVLVPGALPDIGYELAFRAELLSRDKKTVLARSVTPVRHLRLSNPIVISLTGPSRVEGTIDPKAGATVKLSGKVLRLGGMNQDVTVTLEGLPKGIAIPKAVVKAKQTDFNLEVKFPANFKPGEVKGIRLFGTGKLIAPVNVRSKNIDVTLNLLAPKKVEATK